MDWTNGRTDTPSAWCIRKPGKKSVNLPEVQSEEDEWYCNRLINEALMELDHHGKGPVHINVPISEPFFKLPATELPEARVITRYQGLNVYNKDYQPLIDRLNRYQRRMVVVGQMNLIYLFDKKYTKMLYKHFAWFTENISNQTIPGLPIRNIEPLLCSMDFEAQQKMRPELLITYGGHIISKRLKKFLRRHPPVEHWHVAADGQVADLFGSLTTVIEMDPFEFLEKIAPMMDNRTPEYPRTWENLSKNIPQAVFPYSEMSAIGKIIHHLPSSCSLHLANSSTVRYAQLFPLPKDVEVLSNRGTNGIEGSLSTALGYATASDKLNFIFIGDLSFFYDMNALWNANYGSNVRILLLNNAGGEIFHALPGLEMQDNSRRFITAIHRTSARAWAEDRGFRYLSAHNEDELNQAAEIFTQPSITPQPLLLEVFTEKDQDIEHLKTYYHNLKNSNMSQPREWKTIKEYQDILLSFIMESPRLPSTARDTAMRSLRPPLLKSVTHCITAVSVRTSMSSY